MLFIQGGAGLLVAGQTLVFAERSRVSTVFRLSVAWRCSRGSM